MKTIGDLIGGIKVRQAEISQSLATGNATTWETYHRMVGQHAGLQEALDILDSLLKEDNDDR
ncbi:MAG: hypothetical protein FGM60_04705 [Candidatus Planktophila sp.]|nr:hypothetical protein [Candidatus Planktophila sp.]